MTQGNDDKPHGKAFLKTNRVSTAKPCPVCGRPDWCLVAASGAYAVCMRVMSGQPARSRSGGWVHHLVNRSMEHSPALRAPRRSQPRPTRELDVAYRALLRLLELSSQHREQLLQRGLTERAIRACCYRTFPLKGRARLCRSLLKKPVGQLKNVPGFYQSSASGRTWWTLAGRPGLLIPVRNAAGRIRALLIRRDSVQAGPRYQWLSSAGRPGGSGSGAPCHVARPLRGVTDDRLWLTEGPLKADVASGLLSATVIAVPGVAAWRQGLDTAGDVRPEKSTLVVAYDMDCRTNRVVQEHRCNLMLAAGREGWHVHVAEWDSEKGLDDALNAGVEVRVKAVPLLSRCVSRFRRKVSRASAALLPE